MHSNARREREYWFRVRHNWLPLNERAHYFREGQAKQCPMCKNGTENRSHFMGECPNLMMMLKTTTKQLDLPPNTSEQTLKACWKLEHEPLTIKQTERLAKLGYAWYCLRNKCNAHDYNDTEKHEMLMEMWSTSMKRAEEVRRRKRIHNSNASAIAGE